jgi:hypothetical protein
MAALACGAGTHIAQSWQVDLDSCGTGPASTWLIQDAYSGGSELGVDGAVMPLT